MGKTLLCSVVLETPRELFDKGCGGYVWMYLKARKKYSGLRNIRGRVCAKERVNTR